MIGADVDIGEDIGEDVGGDDGEGDDGEGDDGEGGSSDVAEDCDDVPPDAGKRPTTDDAATHRRRIGSCTHVDEVIDPNAASRLSSANSTGPTVAPSRDQCH